MATLVLGAVGTAIAGPIGGAIGALAGSQIDNQIFGTGGNREGPRIKDLAVTTSSYGQPIARQFGSMRVPGTIIWSTDLVESRETSGGGKGKPKTTTFSYSASFAVALSSRPISSIGRIWADGKLLRGAAGDLKSAGTIRIHHGHGDQTPDPLISSAEGGNCPAFRGCAYVVFEDLQLQEFGNRIPALTFEVIADTAPSIALSQISPKASFPRGEGAFDHMIGFSDEGGPVLSTLKSLDRIYPINCVTGDATVELSLILSTSEAPPMLPQSLATPGSDETQGTGGPIIKRGAAAEPSPTALRYYDRSRDYQPGVQRAIGQRGRGQELVLELPAAFEATGAKQLANAKVNRHRWRSETISWKLAELDPQFGPGSLVQVPDHPGIWNIISWEWTDAGIELSLRRLPPGFSNSAPSEAGRINPIPDQMAVPTVLRAFELPWDGVGSSTDASYFVAASATSGMWSGAALYVDQAGSLSSLNLSAVERSVIGETATPLEPSNCTMLEEGAMIEINLVADDLVINTTTMSGLASGANRLLIGNEIIQFLQADQIGPTSWRLSGLLRGRGGTEGAAGTVHPVGTSVVLLDDTIVPLDASLIAEAGTTTVAAIGLGDDEPSIASLTANGISRRPPHPVHPTVSTLKNGSWKFAWERRARGQWRWLDYTDTALIEESETYQVGIGDVEQPMQSWITSQPSLTLNPDVIAAVSQIYPQAQIWVRQIGTYGPSPATLITNLP